MIVVSYGTSIPKKYVRYKKALEKELSSLEIHNDLRIINTLGSRKANTLYKPSFILNRMYEYGEAILWVDIDSRFTSPILQPPLCDVGYVRLDRNKELSIVGSILYFNNTLEGIGFLHEWRAECLKESNYHDHKRFIDVLKRFKGTSREMNLPIISNGRKE